MVLSLKMQQNQSLCAKCRLDYFEPAIQLELIAIPKETRRFDAHPLQRADL
jgi:hypothetical protein